MNNEYRNNVESTMQRVSIERVSMEIDHGEEQNVVRL